MSYFPYLTTVTNVTSAQLLNLATTPMPLVPGRIGCIVDLKTLLMKLNVGAAFYVVNAQDRIGAIHGNPQTPLSTNSFNQYVGGSAASGFINNHFNSYVWGNCWWLSNRSGSNIPDSCPLSAVIGQGIYLTQFRSTFNNGLTANWTTGNGTLTVTCEVSYIVA